MLISDSTIGPVPSMCLVPSVLFFLFLHQPIDHVVAGALALEIELHVVESVAQFLEGRVRIEVLIARG